MAEEPLEKTVFDYLRSNGTDGLTPKELRRALERQLGLAEGELDAKKAEIKQLCADFMAEQAAQQEEEEEDEESDDDEEDEEEAPPPKKAKKEPKPKPEPAEKKEKTFAVETVGGEEAPKQLGKAQSRLMKGGDFLGCGEAIQINLFGNRLSGTPRQFSSGGYGWYTGGKIPIELQGKKAGCRRWCGQPVWQVWAQVGLNVTIPGSKAANAAGRRLSRGRRSGARESEPPL